jgi:phosphoglycerate dehydrogenase-like enzyme
VRTCLLVGRPTPAALERLSAATIDLRYVPIEDAGPEDVAAAEVVFIWDFRWRTLSSHWPQLTRVTWVHTASAGVDHILSENIRSRRLLVSNSAGVFDRPIAEYVLALALSHAKGLTATHAAQRERRWHYRETRLLAGSTMLIVGMGRIGSAIGRAAAALGVVTIGIRRHPSRHAPDAWLPDRLVGVERLPDVVGVADFVVVAAALTPESEGLISRSVIDAMRPSAYFVNVARAPIVDTGALVDALLAGRIAGAALDVFDEEPLPQESPLWDVPNLIVSPHMAGDAIGWDVAVADRFLDNTRRWLAGQPLVNVVDLDRGY